MRLQSFRLLMLLCISNLLSTTAWIDYPADGFATITHYEIPRDYVASCGCTPSSTHYPTAALSQMAYGSSRAYGSHWLYVLRSYSPFNMILHDLGPACGKCFNLTLLHPIIATPPFTPSTTKFIVVKITDLCPLSKNGWCSGTESRTNPWASASLSTRNSHSINTQKSWTTFEFRPCLPIPSDPQWLFPLRPSVIRIYSKPKCTMNVQNLTHVIRTSEYGTLLIRPCLVKTIGRAQRKLPHKEVWQT